MSLSLIDVDDKEIIAAIKAKYNYHLEHSLKYKSMLDAYDGKFTNAKDVTKPKSNSQSQDTLFKESPLEQPVTQGRKTKGTFESIVLEILADGKPRLVTELIEDYFNKTGKKLKTKDFSSKLSIRARNGNKIKNAKFNDFPIEKRFWWAKSDWFDGNLLKSQYVEIIHEKFKSM